MGIVQISVSGICIPTRLNFCREECLPTWKICSYCKWKWSQRNQLLFVCIYSFIYQITKADLETSEKNHAPVGFGNDWFDQLQCFFKDNFNLSNTYLIPIYLTLTLTLNPPSRLRQQVRPKAGGMCPQHGKNFVLCKPQWRYREVTAGEMKNVFE